MHIIYNHILCQLVCIRRRALGGCKRGGAFGAPTRETVMGARKNLFDGDSDTRQQARICYESPHPAPVLDTSVIVPSRSFHARTGRRLRESRTGWIPPSPLVLSLVQVDLYKLICTKGPGGIHPVRDSLKRLSVRAWQVASDTRVPGDDACRAVEEFHCQFQFQNGSISISVSILKSHALGDTRVPGDAHRACRAPPVQPGGGCLLCAILHTSSTTS